ncbi:MAG: hypothetical protein Q9202_005111 [Teloschistes flavicans]
MLPSNFGAGEDGTSSRLNSGPSAFATQREQTISGMTPGSQTRDFRPSPRTDGEHSQRDHVLYQADNYGSPNRYVGKSPNPNTNVASSASRNHRPEPLGFGNIGDGLRINDQQIGTGPKSAPAQVKSFGEHANNDEQQGMNENLFDDRWLQHPEEMYATPNRRPSILTISPDTSPHSPDTSATRHSAAFTDLLHAQLNHNSFDDSASRGLGPLGVHSASQAHVVSSPSMPPGQINDATSRPYVGHGYGTLKSYVEVASSGRAHTSVAELDQLMSTLIELRGDGDTLPSMNHYDRDNLRQFLYQRIFGTTDGSSRLSRAKPSGLIDVAGALVSRQHLHDEIIHFLEDQLDSMTSSPGLQRARAATRESHQAPTHNHNPRQFGAARDVIGLQENEKGRPGFVPSPSSGVQGRGQTVHLTSPVPELQGLSLGEPQPSMAAPRTHQPLTNVGIAPVPHLPLQQHVQFNPFAQGFNPGPQGLSHVQYGPSPIDLQQQQYLAYLHYQQQRAQQSPLYPPNLVISRNGMVSGPNPLMAPSVTFVPGRPGMAQNGPILPYGPQFLPGNTFTGPQFAGPMMPGIFMPNSPMSFGPFPPNLSSWSAPRTQHSFTRQSQFPPHMQLPTSRTSSPANHSRRPVIPVVPSLPYRAGSDDMYPVSVGGMSVRLQELTRDGQPSCAKAFDPRYLPFVENAREAKVAEWGVMKISNIPYSVTKQEIYGLLGRNAKIVTPDLGVGIHIIMERPTGKTQDCFVEFFSYGDAITAIHRCSGRGPNLRLGDRVVTVTMSSQDELMGEMFPRAKNCTWRDGRPVISESEEAYNTGFKSFLTAEELLQMVTHAEKPHRVSTSAPSPLSSSPSIPCRLSVSSSQASSLGRHLSSRTDEDRDAFYLREQQYCVSYTASCGH